MSALFIFFDVTSAARCAECEDCLVTAVVRTMIAITSTHKKETYEHPEDNTITVDTDRSCYPEVLSQPNFIGKVADGTHDRSLLNIMTYADEILPGFNGDRCIARSLLPFFHQKQQRARGGLTMNKND